MVGVLVVLSNVFHVADSHGRLVLIGHDKVDEIEVAQVVAGFIYFFLKAHSFSFRPFFIVLNWWSC